MVTYRTHFRSFRTYVDMTAVTALPYLFTFTIKYLTFLDGDHYQTVITNNDIQDDSACLVIQDSYGSPFDVFLTQHYHTVVVMDFRNGFNAWQVAKEYGIDDIIVVTELVLAQGNEALGRFQYDFRYWESYNKTEEVNP